MGQPLATALIEQIPPMASSDIATKQVLDDLTVQRRGETAELRGEMTGLRGELLGEFAELRGEFRASTRHTLVTIAAAVSVWLAFSVPAAL